MQEEIEIWLTPQKKSFMECKQIKSLLKKILPKKKKTSSLDPGSDVCIKGSQIFKGKITPGFI